MIWELLLWETGRWYSARHITFAPGLIWIVLWGSAGQVYLGLSFHFRKKSACTLIMAVFLRGGGNCPTDTKVMTASLGYCHTN